MVRLVLLRSPVTRVSNPLLPRALPPRLRCEPRPKPDHHTLTPSHHTAPSTCPLPSPQSGPPRHTACYATPRPGPHIARRPYQEKWRVPVFLSGHLRIGQRALFSCFLRNFLCKLCRGRAELSVKPSLVASGSFLHALSLDGAVPSYSAPNFGVHYLKICPSKSNSVPSK